MNHLTSRLTMVFAGIVASGIWIAFAQDAPPTPQALDPLPAVTAAGAKDARPADLTPLQIEKPKPLFVGTPKPPVGTTVDMKNLGRPRGDFLVPRGIELLSIKKPVNLSSETTVGTPDLITDGDREGTDNCIVEFGQGTQWAQIDLKATVQLWAIVIWHSHSTPRVYRDVVVQVSNDPDFITDVVTLFNNDQDNSSGFGLGEDREYVESNEGKLIDARATSARYIRCHSRGSTENLTNHLIEIEAYGKATR